jgi:predicted lactoylglutathione lyase
VSCESKEEVARWVETAGANGGIADVNPPEDHGFMLQRSFADPDGHVWEPMWMDPAVASGEAHISEAEASA